MQKKHKQQETSEEQVREPRKRTPTFLLELPLQVTPRQAARKSKRTGTRASFPPQTRKVGSVVGTPEPLRIYTGEHSEQGFKRFDALNAHDLELLSNLETHVPANDCTNGNR